jgi:hypothetical protein
MTEKNKVRSIKINKYISTIINNNDNFQIKFILINKNNN